MMIQYSSMITETQLQQSWNDEASTLQDIMTENEHHNLKFKNEEVKDELFLDLNEQLTKAILQCNELQKKQKLIVIHLKIKTLQIIETTKRNHLTITWEFIVNQNDLRFIAFIISMKTRWIYHEIDLYKQRLSMSLKKYYDKIIRKHKEWIKDVKIFFQNTSWHFESDEKKILYCMSYLKSESKKLWFNHEETTSAAQQMWLNFIDFLLNFIENSMNWSIDMTQQYANTLQWLNQMIWMFAIFLSILKHQLSSYNDEHKWAHLFIKLRSELRVIIINVQSISNTWDALINLIAWLEINLWKERVLSLKWSQDKDDLYDQDKINKKTHQKRKKSHKSIKLNTSSKLDSNTSIHYNKDLLNIICYTCNRKNHYSINCRDEKTKKRLKKFDVNQVLIDLMLHMNHDEMSKKDNYQALTSFESIYILCVWANSTASDNLQN
jgi:hypothetical protein